MIMNISSQKSRARSIIANRKVLRPKVTLNWQLNPLIVRQVVLGTRR